jgi:peptidoglycan/LPS O-acetylase OafA/YrhL
LRRITALDGLRGVLATVVLADHAAMELGSSALGHAANISVVIFFALSGLVLTRQWDGRFMHFLAVRFVRLWPVYAVCLAGGYALARSRPEILEFVWIPLPRYDANTICPPAWSLFLEAWAALAMPFIAWTAMGGVRRSLAAIVALIAISVVWVPRDAGLRAFECYLVCFVAGAAFAHVGSIRSQVLESAVPQCLGQISYSLYLTHWLVLHAAVLALGPVAGIAAGLPLAFAVAWCVWWAVERPSIRLSRRLKAARPAYPGSPATGSAPRLRNSAATSPIAASAAAASVPLATIATPPDPSR